MKNVDEMTSEELFVEARRKMAEEAKYNPAVKDYGGGDFDVLIRHNSGWAAVWEDGRHKKIYPDSPSSPNSELIWLIYKNNILVDAKVVKVEDV